MTNASAETPHERDDPDARPAEDALPEPVVRTHELALGGKTLRYTTTVGYMPIRDDKGVLEAKLFFTAYTLEQGDPASRPLTITFNGGPGSSSVWLHLGGLAPRRVEMLPDGGMPQPPYKVIDNEHTWLESTDIVFVDPVDTGFSRAANDEFAKKAKSVEGDIASIGEFIRLYITRFRRWSSPLFLSGESYGTFRSAGLAGYLIERGIAFNGIILVSSILNMQTARFTAGNDLPYVLFLPTYAATAWYHGKVEKRDHGDNIRSFLDEVESWVEGTYVPALSRGDRLSPNERQAVIDSLARYTGLDRVWIDQANLRIDIHAFCKELLRSERRTVGRLDSRFKGLDRSGVSAVPDHDPSMSAIRPPFTSALNDYVRRDLGFESDLEYHILRSLEWSWGEEGHADTSEALRTAFARNPYLHLFIASGYFDLATPYYATLYTLTHMNLHPESRKNIQLGEYPVGHMVYLEQETLNKLQRDVAEFIDRAVPANDSGFAQPAARRQLGGGLRSFPPADQ